jgi:methylglutaconyl-CoA hydratase
LCADERLDTIEIGLLERVATVTLNRPDVHNAFNAVLIAELTQAFRDLSDRDDVDAIVLGGNGKSFCAGADIHWMRESLNYSTEDNMADALRMSDMFATIRDVPQAVVGRVQGAALGGGMGLLAVCDIVVAAADAQFGFTEGRLGIVPAVISRFVVPKIGVSWAGALFLTAERFDAERAERIGIVHQVCSPECLDEAIASTLDSLRASGPHALRTSKMLVTRMSEMPPAEQKEFTARTIAGARTSAEGQEGLKAFLERRPPAWRENRHADD